MTTEMTTETATPHYPWDGGDRDTLVHVYEANDDASGQFAIGLDDYADEGEPDLMLTFQHGTTREQVEWVADALRCAVLGTT